MTRRAPAESLETVGNEIEKGRELAVAVQEMGEHDIPTQLVVSREHVQEL